MNKHTFSSRMKMIVAYIMVVAVLMSQLGISAYADNISGDASSDASTNAEAVVSKDVNATTELPKQEVTSEDASSEAVNSSDGWEFNYEVYDEEVTIKGIKRRYTSNLVIPAYIDGYPVRDIDYEAFYKEEIESVELPDTLYSIDSYAFAYCNNLTEVTVPKNVNSLGWGVFTGCESLSKITFLTKAIKSIPSETFEYCKKLTSVSIPSSVKSIDSLAFYRCTLLNKVTFNDGLNHIRNYAFEDCYALTELKIPASVRDIGESAFENCSKVKTVTISGKKTKLGKRCFAKCKALKKISIPSNMSTVPESAFYNCKSLSSVTLNSKLKIIKKKAFAGCEKLKSVKLPGKLYAIGDGAFEGSGLTSVKFDKALKYIGNGAFCGTKLSKVKLPGKVAYIGNRVFKDCKKLKTISIPASVQGLNPGALGGCYSLKSISVSSKNKKYSSKDGVLFNKNKSSLLQYPMSKKSKSYSVPGSVKTIRSSAFEGNPYLKKLSVGAHSIHKNAFANMKSLTTVTLRSGVGVIERGAFEKDKRLTTVNMAGSVKKIYAYAFAYAPIRKIMIPSGITKLEVSAFYQCNNLAAYTGSGSSTYTVKNGVLYSNKGKTLLRYPPKKKGSSFTVPANVTRVAYGAFKDVTALKKLTFNKSIKNLSSSSIVHCKNLQQIVFAEGTKLSSGSYAVYDCDKLAVIVGPKNYILTYMANHANATLITL